MIRIQLALPPLAEQQEIARQVRDALSCIDASAAEAECAITLLQERRAALISAAVTGKIDLRCLADSAEAA